MEAVLYVIDLRRCTDFYRHVAGLDIHQAGDGFCLLGGAGMTMTLVQVPDNIAIGIEVGDPPERRSATPIKLVFPVSDIGATRVLAEQWGGGIDAVDAQWQWAGTIRCDGVDPEGNVLQVSQESSP